MSKPFKTDIRAKTFADKYSSAKGTVTLAYHYIDALSSKDENIRDLIAGLCYHLCRQEVRGKAVCSDEDKFSAEIGMKIATNRAKIKAGKRYLKKITAIRNAIANLDATLAAIATEIRIEQRDLLYSEEKLVEGDASHATI